MANEANPFDQFDNEAPAAVEANPFDAFDEPTGPELQQERVNIAQSALPEGQVQRSLVDVGRGMSNITQGVEQIKREGELKRLFKIAQGQQFFDGYQGKGGSMRAPTRSEREQAAKDLVTKKADYDAWVADKSEELAIYRASTEGRKWSALAGEMVGSSAMTPIPGGGPLIATGKPLWHMAKNMTAEGFLGAGSAGLDFVPEGLSREDNMLLGFGIGSMLRGGMDSIKRVKDNITGKLSKDEAMALISEIRAQNPSLDEAVEVFSGLVDKDFINKQLEGIPKIELDGLTDAMKERLAVFQFMDAEPTRGQVLRDPILMGEEIKMATTDAGERLRLRFEEQNKLARQKLTDITGPQAKERFGSELISVMDEVKENWLTKNNDLYKEAAMRSDPKVKFMPSAFTAMIDESQDKINASPALLNALKEINRNLERNAALPDVTKAIDKEAKASFGNNAAGEMFKLMEYMKQTEGMNAKEGNDIVIRILNDWDDGTLKPREEAVVSKLREAVLADTVEGIGGDIFLEARKNFAQMQDLIEQFPIMQKLGFKKSGTKGKAVISDDEVFKRMVLKSNNRDFNELMDLLDVPRYQAQFAPLKEQLKENVFHYIRKKSLSGGLNSANEATFVPGKFDAALDELSAKGMDKLQRIMSQEEIQALGTIKRYGDFLREPPTRKSALNPSNTAVQALSGAVGILGRTKSGLLLLSAIGKTNENLQKIIDGMQMNRRLAGKKVPGEIADLEKIVHKKPGIGLPSPTPALTQGAVIQKDRGEQERNAIARMLDFGKAL